MPRCVAMMSGQAVCKQHHSITASKLHCRILPAKGMITNCSFTQMIRTISGFLNVVQG